MFPNFNLKHKKIKFKLEKLKSFPDVDMDGNFPHEEDRRMLRNQVTKSLSLIIWNMEKHFPIYKTTQSFINLIEKNHFGSMQ